MRVELRHLRYFIAVAEELHFGRAAARVHIAQPPLSQQIRKLEEELGVQLFTRAGRGIALTHAGGVFLSEARQILCRTDRAVETARRADRGMIGPLLVACGPMGAQSVLARVLPEFRKRHPDVELVLREFLSGDIVEALHGGSVEVGLLLPDFDSELLRRETLMSVPMLAALPAAHPLARRRRIHLNDLADENFVVVSRHLSAGFYGHVMACCQRAGFTPAVIEEATYIPTLLVMVAAGYGVALVPSVVKPEPGVALIPLDDPCPEMQLCMAWKADNRSPVLAAFLATVRACCGKPSRQKRK